MSVSHRFATDTMHSPTDPPPADHPTGPQGGSALLSSMLDVLGVTSARERSLFERLLATQAHRRVAPALAQAPIEDAFDYYAARVEHALGIVQALHGGGAAPQGAPTQYDEMALALGLRRVGSWTDLLTCSPLRHAARLVLTPQQQELLLWIVQGDRSDEDDANIEGNGAHASA